MDFVELACDMIVNLDDIVVSFSTILNLNKLTRLFNHAFTLNAAF